MSDIPNLQNLQNLDVKTRGTTTPLDISSIPNFVPNAKGSNGLQNYRIRYLKLNLDDLADIAELEKIETKAIRGEGCYILGKKDFFFMDKIFILLNFMEEVPDK